VTSRPSTAVANLSMRPAACARFAVRLAVARPVRFGEQKEEPEEVRIDLVLAGGYLQSGVDPTARREQTRGDDRDVGGISVAGWPPVSCGRAPHRESPFASPRRWPDGLGAEELVHGSDRVMSV